jgi:hypothetical protein
MRFAYRCHAYTRVDITPTSWATLRDLMTKPRIPEKGGGERAVEEQPEVRSEEQKATSKTLQELERIQFDALDRAGFDR